MWSHRKVENIIRGKRRSAVFNHLEGDRLVWFGSQKQVLPATIRGLDTLFIRRHKTMPRPDSFSNLWVVNLIRREETAGIFLDVASTVRSLKQHEVEAQRCFVPLTILVYSCFLGLVGMLLPHFRFVAQLSMTQSSHFYFLVFQWQKMSIAQHWYNLCGDSSGAEQILTFLNNLWNQLFFF